MFPPATTTSELGQLVVKPLADTQDKFRVSELPPKLET